LLLPPPHPKSRAVKPGERRPSLFQGQGQEGDDQEEEDQMARSFSAASFLRWCSASPPARRMMAPVKESGTAIAAAGGALWAATATCGPFPFPPALPGVEVAAELGGDRLLAALGGERIPFGSGGASAAAGFGFGFESVVPLDLVPDDDDDDDDGDEDIGAWSGRGWATSGGWAAAGLFLFWGVATPKKKKKWSTSRGQKRKMLPIRICSSSKEKGEALLTCDIEYRWRISVTKVVFHLKIISRLCSHARSGPVNANRTD
jgi:hypothetical protein